MVEAIRLEDEGLLLNPVSHQHHITGASKLTLSLTVAAFKSQSG